MLDRNIWGSVQVKLNQQHLWNLVITTKKKKANLGYSEALTVEVDGDDNTHCFYSSAKIHKQYACYFAITILQLCCHDDRTVLTDKLSIKCFY